jgi:hypothetical protein
MTEASDSEIVSTRQRRIAELAKQMPQQGLTSLNQHLDLAWMREAYRRTRKDGAVGVDGQTAADYEKDLEGNLRSLLERAKSGTYWAPPVRRVHIPKGTGIRGTRTDYGALRNIESFPDLHNRFVSPSPKSSSRAAGGKSRSPRRQRVFEDTLMGPVYPAPTLPDKPAVPPARISRHCQELFQNW